MRARVVSAYNAAGVYARRRTFHSLGDSACARASGVDRSRCCVPPSSCTRLALYRSVRRGKECAGASYTLTRVPAKRASDVTQSAYATASLP